MLKSILPKLAKATTKRHTELKIIETDARTLFQVINDVNKYSDFLPFCSNSKITKKSLDGKLYEAELLIKFTPLLEEQYTSLVRADSKNLTIETKSIQSNILDSLKSRWKLKDNPNHNSKRCKVEFQVEMTVSDPIVSNVLDSVLGNVAKMQVEAFEKRCVEISRN